MKAVVFLAMLALAGNTILACCRDRGVFKREVNVDRLTPVDIPARAAVANAQGDTCV